VLRSLQHVRNARDLAEATDRIAPGRVFRSACPNNASEADAEALQQMLGISELVRVGIGCGFYVIVL
jgi:protein tyrosine/serine phosphatase